MFSFFPEIHSKIEPLEGLFRKCHVGGTGPCAGAFYRCVGY